MSTRAGFRGFTLIELMVSIGLSSVVAVGLYSLSMVASETFQQQQRVSEMQLRLRGAAELLRADIQRAGFMSTPSSSGDPTVCPRPGTPIQAVQLARSSPNPTYAPADNTGITPVRLLLTGNYVTTDQYRIKDVPAGGSIISLQNCTPEYARIANAAAYQTMFIGSVVRLQGINGGMQFGTVTGASYAAPCSSSDPTLTLAVPPVVVGSSSGTSTVTCGLTGLGTGSTVAPIQTVEYRIGNVSATEANAYVGSAAFVTGKTDLVRTVYVAGTGGATIVNGSERIVAEYAVDFDASIVIDNGPDANGEPLLLRYAFGAAQNFSVMDITGTGSARPGALRSLIYRLSVRDRVQDPTFGWTARALSDPLTRFRVFPSQSGAARVRTLTTEVSLPNLSNRDLRN